MLNFPIHALHTIKSDICNLQNNISQDFILCGHEKSVVLLNAIQEQGSEENYSLTLSELCKEAHNAMKSSQRDPPTSLAWRRLYTDASLIWALRDCLNEQNSPNDISFWENIIHILDRAIIIAGAPGKGRLDLLLDTIEYIQKSYLPLKESAFRQVMNITYPEEIVTTFGRGKLPSAALAIPVLEAPPSLSLFRSLSQAPFILRGFSSDWPAVQDNSWASKNYLLRSAGRGRLIPVEVGGDYRTDDWSQRFIPWEEFLDYLYSIDGTEPMSDEPLYLAQYDLFKQFPNLQRDIIIPDYVYTSLPPPKYYPQYKPPYNEDQLVLNTWIGPNNATSPAHIDPYYNMYTQVVGRKLIWLAPPDVSRFISPFPGPNTASAQDGTDPSLMLSNTSRLDVFADEDDLDRVFKEMVVPVAMSAVLEAGDVVFFPPGWWHAMRSQTVSFSVSMWF